MWWPSWGSKTQDTFCWSLNVLPLLSLWCDLPLKPFLNYLVPLFQNKSSCKTFHDKISLMYKRMLVDKTHFHMKGFTQRLILTQKQKGNLKMAFWIWVKKRIENRIKIQDNAWSNFINVGFKRLLWLRSIPTVSCVIMHVASCHLLPPSEIQLITYYFW